VGLPTLPTLPTGRQAAGRADAQNDRGVFAVDGILRFTQNDYCFFLVILRASARGIPCQLFGGFFANAQNDSKKSPQNDSKKSPQNDSKKTFRITNEFNGLLLQIFLFFL